MLKALIADDEIWICQLIKSTIDWDSLDIEPIGFARDGEECYQMIQDFLPDIVITDVRMPVINGIEMIQKVREDPILGNTPYFIIISGYQDFEYVQTALRLGAVDYILKPYNEEALQSSLIRLQEKIGMDITRSKNDQLVRQRLAESIGKLRESGLYDFFHKHANISSLEGFNKEYTFSLSVDNFSLFYIRVNSITGSVASRSLLTYIAEHFINYFHGLGSCIAFPYIENGSVIVIVNHSLSMNQCISESAKQVFALLLGDTSINKQVILSLGILDTPVSVAQLREAFYMARDCADLRFFSGYGRIYYASSFQREQLQVSKLFPAEIGNQLTTAVESFALEKLHAVLLELFKPLMQNEMTHPRDPYDLARMVVKRFCEITGNLKIPTGNMIPAEDLLFPLELCANLADFPQSLYNSLSSALEAYQKLVQEGPSQPVKAAIKYVKRHYMTPIRLTDVAKEVYLSPQYFSELFKNETGVNFSDYLAEYRIEEAKKLLVQPGEKVKYICSKVGYADSKSFSKVFKKLVGLTPREYQKLFS